MRCIKNELNEKQYAVVKNGIDKVKSITGAGLKFDKGLLRDGRIVFKVSASEGQCNPFYIFLSPNKKEMYINQFLYKED